jgi:hypothetical protein
MDAESSSDTPPPRVGTDDGADVADEAAGDGSTDATATTVRSGRPTNRRMRAATVLMVPALVAFVGSAALFLIPVTNPGVQHCGTPAGFLLQAQTDHALVAEDGKPLHGWDTARLRQAQDDRCSVQVADRAVPAAVLLVAFWVLALAAIILGWTGRRALRKQLAVDLQ